MSARHAVVAAVAGAGLVVLLSFARVSEPVAAEQVHVMFVRVLALASAAASGMLVALGRALDRQEWCLRLDAVTFVVAVAVVSRALVSPVSRDGAGLVLVLVLALRLAPVVWLAVRERRTGAGLAFAVSAVAYLALAWWGSVGMAAQGDQAHYLLAAEALGRGSVDVAPLYADPSLYEALALQPLAEEDRVTHAVATGTGLRLLQGYGLPLVVLPGWAIAGHLGALATMALVGAYASAQAQRLVREVAGESLASRAAWALLAFAVPLVSFVTSVFPNALAAALLVSVARWGLVTGSAPVASGLAAGATLFLTPRDGAAAGLLVLAALALGSGRARLVAASLATLAVACLAHQAVYGLPVPYAGYVLGAPQVDAIVGGQRLVGLRPDIALPGLLFDRAVGLAGTAPWVFIGALGLAPLLRRGGRVALALLAVVLLTLAALSLYGPWQGGWSPPNRYTVELLPLWAPFVAAGLASAAGLVRRGVVVLLLLPSLVATLWLAAIPRLAYSGNESELALWLGKYVPANPFLLLPSYAREPLAEFQLHALVFGVGLAVLVWLGARIGRAERSG